MKLVHKYDYLDLERVTHENGSRYYVEPNGAHLSSVTTILSATDHSPELQAWQDRVGLVEAERVRNEATGLGSLMHEHLENHVGGLERPRGNNLVRKLAEQMADQIILKGLPNVDEVWGMEKILYMPGKYAGTTDLVGVHQGDEAILDYKTTKKMKTKAKIPNYFCQGAAYALAHNELFGTDIRKVVVFMVARDLKFEEFVIDRSEFQTWADMWNFKLEAFMKMRGLLDSARNGTDAA